MEEYSEEEATEYESSLNGFEQDEPSNTLSDEEAGYDGMWSQEDYSNLDYEYDPGEGVPEPEPPDRSLDVTNRQRWYEEVYDQASEVGELHGDDSWRGDSDFQICNGEESCHGETDSQFSQEEEEVHPKDEGIPWCEIPYSNYEGEHQEENDSQSEDIESQINSEDERSTLEGYGGDSFLEEADSQIKQQDDTIEEDRPWCEIPEDDYDDASYDGVKPWCEETDSQISLDESQESFDDKPEPKEEFNEENEAKSEAGRDEVRFINFAGHHQGPEAYLRWEQDMEDWLSSNQIPEEEKTVYAEDTLTEDAFRRWEQDAYIHLEYDEPDASWEDMKQLLYEEFVEDAGNMRQHNLRIYTNLEPRRWILAKPKPATKIAFHPKTRRIATDTLKERNEFKSTTPAKKERPKAIAPNPSAKLLCNRQGKGTQGKSSNLIKINDLTCYKCKNIGHIAKDCPKKKKLIPHDDGEEQNLVTQATPAKEESQVSSNLNLIISDKTCSTTCLIHLSATKDAEKVSSTKEENRDQEEASKATKVFSDRNQNQGEQTPVENEATAKEDESVNETINLKEEPPDAQQTDQNRGKILNPFSLQWTNLEILCAGGKVLRTKPLEEGGDDVRINTNIDLDMTDTRSGTCADMNIGTIGMEKQGGNMNVELIKYLDGQGCDIHQQYAYFGDIYRTTFEDQHAEQELTQRVEQEMAQDKSHLPFLEPSAFNSQRSYSFQLVSTHKLYTVNLDAPKSHHFQPKLSRLKANHNFPNLVDFII